MPMMIDIMEKETIIINIVDLSTSILPGRVTWLPASCVCAAERSVAQVLLYQYRLI